MQQLAKMATWNNMSFGYKFLILYCQITLISVDFWLAQGNQLAVVSTPNSEISGYWILNQFFEEIKMSLTKGQILRLVNDYIGVTNGYLGQPENLRFTYRTHEQFYPIYCELDSINPNSLQGTTRERFIHILLNATPLEQAKIIKGVFKKFPITCIIPDQAPISISGALTEFGVELEKRKAIQTEYLAIAEDLEKNSLGKIINIIDSESALKALKDAEVLMKQNGAQSAVDRVHTILHDYLISICKKNMYAYTEHDSITGLFKVIRENHASFKHSKDTEIGKIMKSLGSVIDVFNPIRNHKSLAHPNTELLKEEDAHFVIDVVIAIIQFISRKIKI